MNRFAPRRSSIASAALLIGATCAAYVSATPGLSAAAPTFPNTVVPAPVSETADGTTFTLPSGGEHRHRRCQRRHVPGGHPAYLDRLRAAGHAGRRRHHHAVAVRGTGQRRQPGLPARHDRIDVVVIRANQPAGLFAGVQTLLQLLPPAVLGPTVRAGPWTVPGGTIVDYPRFAYRGAMLDVARHFFTVAQVKRYIDEIALYKINYLHLHLSDDQGWRIAINGWPNLADLRRQHPGRRRSRRLLHPGRLLRDRRVRGDTLHHRRPRDRHARAHQRGARLVRATELQRRRAEARTPAPTSGSARCACPWTLTYAFIDQVIGQLAALTPGPYIHIGGDEASSTPAADYAAFIDTPADRRRARQDRDRLARHREARPAAVAPSPSSGTPPPPNAPLAAAAARGTKVVMSPANHAYLDMKYTRRTKLGPTWAGLIDVDTAYGWNPGAYLHGVGESRCSGVEAPLWTETIVTSADIDYMAFPRLPAIAELGWSPWARTTRRRSTPGSARKDHAGRPWGSATTAPPRSLGRPARSNRPRDDPAGRQVRPAASREAGTLAAGRRARRRLRCVAPTNYA